MGASRAQRSIMSDCVMDVTVVVVVAVVGCKTCSVIVDRFNCRRRRPRRRLFSVIMVMTMMIGITTL